MKYALRHKSTRKYVESWDSGGSSGMRFVDNIYSATLTDPCTFNWVSSYANEGHMYLVHIRGASRSCDMFVDMHKNNVEVVKITFVEEE